MDSGQTVFRQLLHFLPRHDFNQCVLRYHGNYRAKSFSTFDQFLRLTYAQIAGRESLRDIETCLIRIGTNSITSAFGEPFPARRLPMPTSVEIGASFRISDCF